jgi:hypothetical protein
VVPYKAWYMLRTWVPWARNPLVFDRPGMWTSLT